ncbi:hypothetical protein MXB_5455 [Myxobolus squamalis]|nr:hypothetical protein MXB_5455 [Myxobolus squamalis]
MEELSEFFELETWEPCPLPDNFSFWDMIEFKFLTEKNEHPRTTPFNLNYYILNDINPFSELISPSIQQKNASLTLKCRYFGVNSASESPDYDWMSSDIKQLYEEVVSNSKTPISCNSFFNVLRIIGTLIIVDFQVDILKEFLGLVRPGLFLPFLI